MYQRSFTFDSLTKIKYGIGIAETIGDEAKRFAPRKVLVVTDKGIIMAGLLDKIMESLKRSEAETLVFDQVEPNPKDETVEKEAAFLSNDKVDLIVAVGGGSSMDTAKAIGLLATNGGSICSYSGVDKVQKPSLPVITIPTTAGTGSEISPWLVIDDTSKMPPTKESIGSRLVSPCVSLVDPLMTVRLPPSLTAGIGIDALTNAIEAYTCTVASPFTDALSLYSIELVSRNLSKAFANGDNLEARGNMMVASLMAGVAFFNADVAGVHCMAEAIGGLYNTPHGVSCAVFLPCVMEQNLIANEERYADIARAMGENITGLSIREAALRSLEAVKRLLKDIAIPSPQQLGVREADIPQLAEMAVANISAASNPRKLTKEDYVELFERAMKEGLTNTSAVEQSS